MTIGYVKEFDYKEKDPPRRTWKFREHHPPKTSTITAGEVIEIPQEKLPLCQKNQHLHSTIISIPNLK